MRKATKVFLIIATVCVIVGAATATTAFALAGFNLQTLSTTKPKTQEHYTSPSATIDSITFTGVEDNLQVVYGDVQSVEVDYWQNDAHPYKITQDNSSTHLAIRLDYNWRYQLFNFDWFNFTVLQSDHPVVITLPESYNGSLVLTTVSGSIIFDKNIQKLDTLELKTVSGDVDYSLQKARYVAVETVSGSIRGFVAGAVDKANFSTISADVKLEFGSVHYLTVQTVSGNAEIHALDKPVDNYSFDVDTVSGNISVPVSSKTAENNVSFNSISGNLMFITVKSLSPSLSSHLSNW